MGILPMPREETGGERKKHGRPQGSQKGPLFAQKFFRSHGVYPRCMGRMPMLLSFFMREPSYLRAFLQRDSGVSGDVFAG